MKMTGKELRVYNGKHVMGDAIYIVQLIAFKMYIDLNCE